MSSLLVEEAQARILAAAPAPTSEAVALSAAHGRVLAQTVTADRDQPPFAASAMDGWAVNGPGEVFEIVGESAAGHGYHQPLLPGQAVRIFTGAPAPAGADRVVIQEEAVRDGERVQTPEAGRSQNHIRPGGGDFRTGQVLLEAGVRLDAWRIGLAAAAGCATLTVARRPRVVVLSTGEELVAPGGQPGPDQIFNSGTPALSALIEAWGGEAVPLASAGDDVEAIAEAVSHAGGDLVVTLGGASVGDHDLVKPALADLGLNLIVTSVRVRPGKPTWFGKLTDGRRVLGLPGNPASAMVCAELFLRPLLMAMQGADPTLRMVSACLAKPLPANGPREHWARARVSHFDGRLIVEAMADQDSSLVTVFAEAGALIRRPIDAPAAEAGAVVELRALWNAAQRSPCARCGDDLGDHRDRNLPRRLAAEIQPDRRPQPRQFDLADARRPQSRQPFGQPASRAQHPDIGRGRRQGGEQGVLVGVPIVGGHRNGRPGVETDRSEGPTGLGAAVGEAGQRRHGSTRDLSGAPGLSRSRLERQGRRSPARSDRRRPRSA